MSKLWEDLKENMRDWSNSAVEKAEEMSRVAMAKTEEMTKISKLKFEIHQIYRSIDSNNQKLGKLVYRQIKKDNNSTFSGNQEFFDIIVRVDDLKAKITKKTEEIEKIKIEYDINDGETENQKNELIKNKKKPHKVEYKKKNNFIYIF